VVVSTVLAERYRSGTGAESDSMHKSVIVWICSRCSLGAHYCIPLLHTPTAYSHCILPLHTPTAYSPTHLAEPAGRSLEQVGGHVTCSGR
jgi:hypothetical protein